MRPYGRGEKKLLSFLTSAQKEKEWWDVQNITYTSYDTATSESFNTDSVIYSSRFTNECILLLLSLSTMRCEAVVSYHVTGINGLQWQFYNSKNKLSYDDNCTLSVT
jgi:hypothetical protein